MLQMIETMAMRKEALPKSPIFRRESDVSLPHFPAFSRGSRQLCFSTVRTFAGMGVISRHFLRLTSTEQARTGTGGGDRLRTLGLLADAVELYPESGVSLPTALFSACGGGRAFVNKSHFWSIASSHKWEAYRWLQKGSDARRE